MKSHPAVPSGFSPPGTASLSLRAMRSRPSVFVMGDGLAGDHGMPVVGDLDGAVISA